MKLLFQHNHHPDEIAGVLTYIDALDQGMQLSGIRTQTVSTKITSFWQQMQAVLWADIVHMNSNSFFFALICKLFGKKIILKYHYLFYQTTHFTYEPMSFKRRLKIECIEAFPKAHYPLKWKLHGFVKYIRLATRLATAFVADRRIACSQFLAESYSFPLPIDTVYNPAVIPAEPTKKTLASLAHPYTFVYVGRLSHDKGVDLLLRATKLLQDEGKEFQVLIMGAGDAAESLKVLSHELDLSERVKFLGVCTNAEILSQLRTALALVAPSRWQDPAPYVAFEASSVQTCSIVAQVGGLPEVATPHSLVFERENSEALAAVMKHCLANPSDCLERGQKAYQYALEHFAPDKITQQMLNLCQDLKPDLKPDRVTADFSRI